MMKCYLNVWSFFALFIEGLLAVSPIMAQPVFPSRMDLLTQEAEQSRSLFRRSSTIMKPIGEMVEDFDLTEVQVEYRGQDRLPTDATIRLSFTSLIDNLTELQLFAFGLNVEQLSVLFSTDRLAWEEAMIRPVFGGGFAVSLPRILSVGQEAFIQFETDMDWSDEPAINAVDSDSFSHLITSKYLPFNGQTFIFDQFTLTTVMSRDAGINPAGLGQVLARPPNGSAGEWIYQSEIDTYLSIYAVGGQYPQSIDGRIEIFDPPNDIGPINSSTIIDSMVAVIPVYEAFYGEFPFERLSAYPISDRAGAAIGPQAQILLPWYFWLDNTEFDDPNFEPRAVIYHEIAHQYFFNTVKLHPDPDLGQAWLSEAMAEFSAIRALEETEGDALRHRWANFFMYLTSVDKEGEVPVGSLEVNEHPNYFEIVYLRGSTLLYGIYHRMEDFTALLRQCMVEWRGLFIDYNDMFNCFRSMTPKADYERFDINAYIDRYFLSTTRDQLVVEARYIDDEVSELTIDDVEWQDALEIVHFSADGEVGYLYTPRRVTQNFTHRFSALLVDPEVTTPRIISNTYPEDVDLNGVVDGQDALDVLFANGGDLLDSSRVFPIHLDVDQDLVISNRDITEVQRLIGRINR